MPAAPDWLKISCHVPEHALSACEDLLWAAGAASISVLDQGDHALLEPPPGSTPVWPSCRVEALFAAEIEPETLLARLRPALPAADAWSCTRIGGREDWERAWMDDFQPMAFGSRLWVCPTHADIEAEDAVVVRMDPGLAFGSGTHPSTALCLEWLDAVRLQDREVLDFGCGSGILAIAALRLGAARAWALDIDPQARAATRANAERNGVAPRLRVLAGGERPPHRVDVVLANILAGPLLALAPELAACHRPDGQLTLAGLLLEQQAAVRRAYRPWYRFDPAYERDGWVRLEARRRPPD